MLTLSVRLELKVTKTEWKRQEIDDVTLMTKNGLHQRQIRELMFCLLCCQTDSK